jgi:hypothetical protein
VPCCGFLARSPARFGAQLASRLCPEKHCSPESYQQEAWLAFIRPRTDPIRPSRRSTSRTRRFANPLLDRVRPGPERS